MIYKITFILKIWRSRTIEAESENYARDIIDDIVTKEYSLYDNYEIENIKEIKENLKEI